jgi:hypothetical protein
MRLGIIKIKGQTLRYEPESLSYIFKLGIVPLDMKGNCWEDDAEIKCYFEGFRDLEDIEMIPHYNIIVDKVDGKEANITFEEVEYKS